MNHIFGIHKRYWYSDIDIHSRPNIVSKLSELTSHPYASIHRTTLTTDLNNISMYSSQSALPTWVMPTYFRPSRKNSFGQQVCPHCLEEHGYYYKLWRLGILTGCPIHKKTLIDRCPNCGMTISLRNIKTMCTLETFEDLLKCSFCGFDYRNANPPILSVNHLNITQWLYYLLGFLPTNDSTLSMPSECTYSNQVFEGLRYLAELILCRNKSSVKLYPKNTMLNTGNLQPIHFPIENRIEMTLLIGEWLGNWPESFLKAITDNQLRLNDIIGKRDLVPWWINKVVLEEISNFRSNRISPKRDKDMIKDRELDRIGHEKNHFKKRYKGLINRALSPHSPSIYWGVDIRDIFFGEMNRLILALEESGDDINSIRVRRDRLYYAIMSDYKVSYSDAINLDLKKGIYRQIGKRVEKKFPITLWKNSLLKFNSIGLPIKVKNPRVRFKGYLDKFGFPLSIRMTCLYRI